MTAAPQELEAWLETQGSPEAAWTECERADWLFYLAQPKITDHQQRRRLVAAVASALGVSEHPGATRRQIALANAWAANSLRDRDPTGFAATIVSVTFAAAVGIAIDLWLWVRPNNPIRGMRREAYSMPVFLVLVVVGRLVARPLLKRRWQAAVQGYTFERAESQLFPRLDEAVARSGKLRGKLMADVFRKRMAGQ